MQWFLSGMSRPRATRVAAIVLGLVGMTVLVWWIASSGEPSDSQMNSTNAQERIAAIAALGKSGSTSASEKLARLASHSDTTTVRYAVRALGENDSEGNRKALTGILTDTKMSAAARSEAASMLGKFKESDAALLTRTLAADESPEVRAGAAKGLARLEMPSTIPQLSAALEDPSPEVRLWAITAIHRMIGRRFPYNATKPPETQKTVIEEIRAYLRRCKVL